MNQSKINKLINPDQKLYSIVKFSKDKENEVISTGHTLQQARDICSDPGTKGEGWFYGFTEE